MPFIRLWATCLFLNDNSCLMSSSLRVSPFKWASNVSSINDIVPALAALLGTPEGAVLAWIHFVIGDIVTTRWIWRRSVERNLNNRIAQLSIFFGVMLMPLGLLIYVLTTIDLSKSEE